MQDLDLSADFLAWAGDIPFLVSWELDRGRGRGAMVFRVADTDFTNSWAPSPVRYEFPADAVAHYGLQSFAGQFVTIMQNAQEAEAAFADGR